MSEFLRRLSLDLSLKNKLTNDEIECYKSLSKYADNFRRISNLFKLGDVTGMKNETMETSRLIRKHLEKIYKMIGKASACIGGYSLFNYVMSDEKGYEIDTKQFVWGIST